MPFPAILSTAKDSIYEIFFIWLYMHFAKRRLPFCTKEESWFLLYRCKQTKNICFSLIGNSRTWSVKMAFGYEIKHKEKYSIFKGWKNRSQLSSSVSLIFCYSTSFQMKIVEKLLQSTIFYDDGIRVNKNITTLLCHLRNILLRKMKQTPLTYMYMFSFSLLYLP